MGPNPSIHPLPTTSKEIITSLTAQHAYPNFYYLLHTKQGCTSLGICNLQENENLTHDKFQLQLQMAQHACMLLLTHRS